MNFLFFLYLIGVLFAVYSDFTRREIDDSVNLFLFFLGILYLIVDLDLFFTSSLLSWFIFLFVLFFFSFFLFSHAESSVSSKDNGLVLFFKGFVIPSFFVLIFFLILFIFYGLSNIPSIISLTYLLLLCSILGLFFYYARFFSGGDVKLFFAISPILFSISFNNSIINLSYFIFFLLLCGSIYSILYGAVFFLRDFKKNKKYFLKEINKKYNYLLIFLVFVFILLGFAEKIFFLFSLFIALFIFLICFAKSLEEVSMKRYINTKDLREGDWLYDNVKVGNKVFKKNWEGLTQEDISYMKKFNKKVFVKDGIPYAPSFLFALILFQFRDYLLGIIFS